MKKLSTSLTSSLLIIPATAYTYWGWCHSNLKIAFHALIHSKLNYTIPAWQPWLSATNISYLDCLQNCALRLVTYQFVSTPLETLRLEADVQSYNTCSKWLILRAREKALRSFGNHPKRLPSTANIPQHLPNRYRFRRKTNNLSIFLPVELDPVISSTIFNRWQFSTSRKEHISTFVPGIADRAKDTSSKR